VVGELPLDQLAAAAFDALPMEAVLVDPAGYIRHVNRAWRDFASNNGGAADYYIGHNYLTMLSHIGPPLDHLAATIAQGLRAVLTGRAAEFVSPEHLDHRPSAAGSPPDDAVTQAMTDRRWVRLRIRPLIPVTAATATPASRWAMLIYETVTSAHPADHPGSRVIANRVVQRAPAEPGARSAEAGRLAGDGQLLDRWPANSAVFLQTVLDDIADMVVTTDDLGRIQSFNRAAEAAFGLSAANVLGSNVALLMADGDAARHDDYMQRYRDTQVPHILGLTRQVQARRSDGDLFWIDLRTTECWFDGHRLFVSTMRDMSERRRMEADLRQAKQAAEASNRAKSDFLARMSHELRTPLNSILGFAEVIKGQLFGDDAARYADYAQHIYDSGSWLLGLINDILDLSKIEAGRLELNIARLAPLPLIAAAIDIVAPQFARRQIGLVLDLPSELPVIDIDARAFQQVLINLLGNAVKFTLPGGQARITASIQPAARMTDDHLAGNELRLMISDTGIGIAPDKITRVLEPFGHSDQGPLVEADGPAVDAVPGAVSSALANNADGAPADGSAAPIQKGSGLGLSICKRLMELQGGHLSLASELGRGTTVTLTFPLLD
jgi:PAS domain S-box-containing protein